MIPVRPDLDLPSPGRAAMRRAILLISAKL
jgi:hypothetical protein